METNFLVSLVFVIITGITIIISIALHDIRMLRVKNNSLRKKRRAHPLVTVEVEENVSDECLAAVRHNDYHNYDIVFSGEHIHSKFILSLRNNALLAPTAIRSSVEVLVDFPQWDYVEIKPVLAKPQKLYELFHLYHIIILAPFISLRSTFNIPPNLRQPWPILRRSAMPVRHFRSRIYHFIRWSILVVNAVILAYITVVAFSAGEPLYLLTYLSALLLWLVVCLIEYPHFSRKQKVLYALLSPVSFWYFFSYAFYAPLVPIVRTIANKIASIFWRAHHQTIA